MDAADLEGALEKLHPASFSWALGCCGWNREDAEDVLQASYLKVLEQKARFDGRASFKTFLFGVIRRTAAEQRRRRFFYRWKLSDWAVGGPAPLPAGDPEKAAARSEQTTRLRAAMVRLARRQREVLQLVFGHELTVEEAAAVLGISTGSARAHYDRGKKRLLRQLEGTP
jgi:RNA polymerase sigma-70 factor, ECF subfamily